MSPAAVCQRPSRHPLAAPNWPAIHVAATIAISQPATSRLLVPRSRVVLPLPRARSRASKVASTAAQAASVAMTGIRMAVIMSGALNTGIPNPAREARSVGYRPDSAIWLEHGEQLPCVFRLVEAVADAGGESDSRPCQQVLDSARDKDLGRPGQRGDPIGDVHRRAGHPAVRDIHFAGVDGDTRASTGCGANRRCAADRLAWSIEDRENRIRIAHDHAAFVRAHHGSCRHAGKLAGEHESGQHAVAAGLGRFGAGQEGSDLAEERVAFAAGCEAQGMIAWLLEVASIGDVRGQISALAWRVNPIAATLYH